MATVLVLLSLVMACVGWGKLAGSMRINGRPWWLRHLAGSTAGFWAFMGFLFILDGAGIALGSQPSVGTAGFVFGVLLTLPLAISLFKSFKASHPERAGFEQRLAEKREANRDSQVAKRQETPKAAPSPSLQETLESNREAARSAVSSREWKKQAAKAKHKDLYPSGDWKQETRKLQRKTTPPPPVRSRSTAPDDSADRTLSFAYTDTNGNQTHREVINWRFDGTYIKGFCLMRNTMKTFRRDRIDYFLSGEDLLEETATPRSRAPKKPRRSEAAFEILFTGFTQSEKQRLESDAREAGMVIRKNVSKNLNFLCIGPNAGPSKVDAAAEKGATILDQDAFEDLLETGALPN